MFAFDQNKDLIFLKLNGAQEKKYGAAIAYCIRLR
jgi:hypothetical protein